MIIHRLNRSCDAHYPSLSSLLIASSVRTDLVGKHWCICVSESIEECRLCSSLFLQQCPTGLVLFGWFVRWEESGRTAAVLWGCCSEDLFKTEHRILVYLSFSFFSKRFVRVREVQAYSSIDTTTAWKKIPFYSIRKIRFLYDRQPLTVYTFSMRILTPLSVDEILLPRYVNCRLISKACYLMWRWPHFV